MANSRYHQSLIVQNYTLLLLNVCDVMRIPLPKVRNTVTNLIIKYFSHTCEQYINKALVDNGGLVKASIDIIVNPCTYDNG